jgi:hypothetical protein
MNDSCISRRRTTLKATIGTAGILLATYSWRVAIQAAGADDKPAGVLFIEGFDDARLFDRGWYDGDAEKFHIAHDGAHAGAGCIAFHWKADRTPDFSGSRHHFEPSETVYLRCYIKLSKGWGWTGRAYHPHCMHFMTTENDSWHGPAASHLTMYIEPWNGKLRLAA